jgi:(2Fe-2S) ferredoxin
MSHSGRDWNQAAAQITAAKPLQLSPNVPPGIRAWIDGRGYPELFQEAFGTPDVTPAKISMAIASYERTLYSDRAPIDLANAGIQPLTAQEQRGRSVFNLAQCNFCHVGQLLADNTFHNIGVRPANEDTGRFQVTNDPQNLGEFRTPSLRNVELRAPYMHNGRFATLEQVVDFYDRGGDFPNAPNFPADLIHPRGLTAQQKADLVAFLKRPLTDPRVAAESAPFDRPQLFSESGRVPVIVGQGTAGSGGSIPHPIAIEPPLSGNPSFTVAVTNVLAGAAGVLVIDSSDPGNTSNVPSAGSFARVNIQVSSGGNGAGYSSVSLQIPADRSLIGRTFFGRWYISDPGASNGVAVSPAFRFTIFGGSQSTARARHADFDGDGRTDLSVYRPSLGNWYIQQSSNNVMSAANFGLSNDVLAPEDFDGDGRTDIAVYRDGVWYIMRSRDGLQIVQWGLPGDVPQPGDYDGDGIADIAVWRPSDRIWYLLESRDGFRAGQFGLSTDRPVAADYDGDGKTDIAVYRDGIWYLQRSTEGWAAFQFGLAEDRTVAGDYDGDGKADAAVYRPSTGVWYVLKSSDGGFSAAQFGISTDVPSPGDYDGDGKFDLGVFRPSEGNWYVLLSQTGTARIEHWGMAGDLSVPASFVQ